MKALSFHQPRAEQVMRGAKTVDIRTWQTAYRGRIAVHAAAKRRDARCRALGFDPAALDYGALLGVVTLVDVQPLTAETYADLQDQHLVTDPFPGDPCYAWFFEEPRRFESAIPYRGRMRLFNVELADGEGQPEPVLSPSVSAPAKNAAPKTSSPTRTHYQAVEPPEPDPERPFALYAVPGSGNGYGIALYQWVATGHQLRESSPSQAPGALWHIEVEGDVLRAVMDHLLKALRANGYKATELAHAVGREMPFYLNEPTGLRLALILLAVKPLSRQDRISAIGQGIQVMSDEEAYYWFSKCSAGPAALRAQKALRILLSDV